MIFLSASFSENLKWLSTVAQTTGFFKHEVLFSHSCDLLLIKLQYAIIFTDRYFAAHPQVMRFRHCMVLSPPRAGYLLFEPGMRTGRRIFISRTVTIGWTRRRLRLKKTADDHRLPVKMFRCTFNLPHPVAFLLSL